MGRRAENKQGDPEPLQELSEHVSKNVRDAQGRNRLQFATARQEVQTQGQSAGR